MNSIVYEPFLMGYPINKYHPLLIDWFVSQSLWSKRIKKQICMSQQKNIHS